MASERKHVEEKAAEMIKRSNNDDEKQDGNVMANPPVDATQNHVAL